MFKPDKPSKVYKLINAIERFSQTKTYLYLMVFYVCSPGILLFGYCYAVGIGRLFHWLH